MKLIVSLILITTASHLTALSQILSFRGRAIEENGMPVPFATISVKGLKNSIVANDQGAFIIKAKANDTLIISAINFQIKEIIAGSIANSNITLLRNANALNPVMVTIAFDIKKEQRTTPYSAQVITSDVINIIPQTNLNDALVGKVAGIQFRTQSGAKLNSQTFARVRGGLLLSGDAAPAYIVDGTVVTDAYDIDPSIIENITVLKGANSTAIF